MEGSVAKSEEDGTVGRGDEKFTSAQVGSGRRLFLALHGRRFRVLYRSVYANVYACERVAGGGGGDGE